MKISFAEPRPVKSGTLVVGVAAERTLTPEAAAADGASGGAVLRAIDASRFSGKADQFLSIPAPASLAAQRLVLAGLGRTEDLDGLKLEALGGGLYAHLAGTGETEVTIDLGDPVTPKLGAAEAAARIAYGFRLRGFRFDRYRTRLKDEQKPAFARLTILVHGAAAAKKRFAEFDEIADGVALTRMLVSEPGNVIYPETLAEAASGLEKEGVEVEILDEKKLKKLGLGALLAVGQGSARPPCLIVMRWSGAADKSAPPVALIGKGITFDTGGISLKPGPGMEEMKWDMAGAGAVIGTMRALAGRNAKANVVGIVAAAENMPDGRATRPGDIVASLSGQTIEINNTDAEGRLVLADALWYAQDRFKPVVMVDLATLTGAIIVALGDYYAGLYANDEALAVQLLEAGKATGEPLWRMPLDDRFDKLIDSDAADMKNISGGREAGSIIAAQFLKRFVNGTRWAHLDIAGTAWDKKDGPLYAKGATGFGVRLLDRLIATNYED